MDPIKSHDDPEITTLSRLVAARVQGDWQDGADNADGREESGVRPPSVAFPPPATTAAAFNLVVKEGSSASKPMPRRSRVTTTIVLPISIGAQSVAMAASRLRS